MAKRKAWNKKYTTAAQKLNAQIKWTNDWRRKNLKVVSFSFNKTTYPEVAAKLEEVESKNRYILNLILKDLGLDTKEEN